MTLPDQEPTRATDKKSNQNEKEWVLRPCHFRKPYAVPYRVDQWRGLAGVLPTSQSTIKDGVPRWSRLRDLGLPNPSQPRITHQKKPLC